MVYTFLLALMLLAPSPTFAEGESSVVLYQVGSKGKYCLSLTRDESGCISGEDKGGNSINIMDVTRGKNVRFENLSDAPHDMRITGSNKENLPAQGPGAAPVNKLMAKEDRNKEKITCSFHGDQLGVGYRVLDDSAGSKSGGAQDGHKEPGAGSQAGAAGGGGGGSEGDLATSSSTGPVDPSRPIRQTGLADVSKEVLTKGRPDEVQKLIEARPELMAQLQEIRPFLAQEIAEKAAGGETSGELSALAAQEAAKALQDGSAVALDANGNPILGEGNGTTDGEGLLASGEGEVNRVGDIDDVDGEARGKAADEAFERTRALTATASRASLADLAFGGKLGRGGKATRSLASMTSPMQIGPEKDARGFFFGGSATVWKFAKLLLLLTALTITGRGFYLVLFARRKKEDKESV